MKKAIPYGKLREALYIISFSYVLFLLPFNGKVLEVIGTDHSAFLPSSLLMMFVFSITSGHFKIKGIWKNWTLKAFVFLFGAYLISAVVMSSMEGVADELTKKLSLVVVPFSIVTNQSLVRKWKKHLFMLYFSGVVFTLLFLDVRGVAVYMATGEFPFYGQYTAFTHPTYLGANVLISFIFLFSFFIRSETSFLRNLFQIILIMLLALHMLLLLSKAVIIAAVIALFYYFFLLLFNDIKKFAMYVIVFISPILTVIVNPNLYHKAESVVSQRFSNLERYDQATGSTAFRYKINRHSLDLIGENWLLGVGVGKEQAHLMSFYQKMNWNYALNGAFNSHNQFVQTWLSVGLFGFLLLLAIIFAPLFIGEFGGNKIILLSFAFLFCTEAMLERQAGIVLFVLFYAFSFALSGKEKISKGLNVNKGATY